MKIKWQLLGDRCIRRVLHDLLAWTISVLAIHRGDSDYGQGAGQEEGAALATLAA